MQISDNFQKQVSQNIRKPKISHSIVDQIMKKITSFQIFEFSTLAEFPQHFVGPGLTQAEFKDCLDLTFGPQDFLKITQEIFSIATEGHKSESCNKSYILQGWPSAYRVNLQQAANKHEIKSTACVNYLARSVNVLGTVRKRKLGKR